MSSFQDKLNKYEVIPPTQVWDRIAAALDEEKTVPQYPSTLYNLEVVPPAAAWSAISASLEAAHIHPVKETKVVPLRKRIAGFYRYAVAALVIIIAGLGILKWTVGNSHQHTPAVVAATGSSADTGKPATAGLKPPATPVMQDSAIPEPGVSSKASEGLAATTNGPAKPRIHRAADAIAAVQYNDEETARDVRSNPIYAYEDHVPDMADRYIMLMTPEGKFIRMSKKWGNLVCCVSGEEQDPDCKDQLKKWQEKIASSPLAPSPGNFLDILSLVSSLQDNQGM